jgi:tRNA U38,U39,U40 pseudouridine synthase TruA
MDHHEVKQLMEKAYNESSSTERSDHDLPQHDTSSVEPSDATNSRANLTSDALNHVHSFLRNYRLDNATLSRFKHVLELFSGAHNFHNYGYKKGVTDPSAMRYINRFKTSDPFIVSSSSYKICEVSSIKENNSINANEKTSTSSSSSSSGANHESEWLLVEVVGKSFMHHQIRKMLATVVDFSRRKDTIMSKGVIQKLKEKAREIAKAKLKTKGNKSILDDVEEESDSNRLNDDNKDTLMSTFEGYRMKTSLLPAIGLYLDRAYFEEYNKVLKEKCNFKKDWLMRREKYDHSDNGNLAHIVSWKNKHEVKWEPEGDEDEMQVDDTSSVSMKERPKTDYEMTQNLKRKKISEALQEFKSTVVWPHIFKQAESSQDFVRWLDVMDHSPLDYSAEVVSKPISNKLRLDRKNLLLYENTEELVELTTQLNEEREKRRAANKRGKKKRK